MQPVYDPTSLTGHTGHPDDAFQLVASRRYAFETLRSAATLGRPGPVLITGESGAGKTALVRRFAAEDRARRCLATVDLAAEMNALEFLRLVGHALGVSSTSRLGKARLRLEGALANEATEGRRWILVVDRAHRGRSGVWDEVQAIASQLGRSRGFAGLFIVGETDLARSLASRRSSIGLAAQVCRHIHLRPLDLDEARDLLDSADVVDVADGWMLEELHRKSRGNPALLLRLARKWSQHRRVGPGSGCDRSERSNVHGLKRRSAPLSNEPIDLDAEAQPDSSREVVKEQNGSTWRAERGSARPEAPALIPSKAPIRDEDGLVEVGWEGDLEDEISIGERPTGDPAAFLSDQSPLDEELIEDRYAALQSQSELTRNEAWLTTNVPAHSRQMTGDLPEADGSTGEPPALPRDGAAGTAPGGIRAEGQHDFAPYSQLFTRFRQSK